MHSYASICALRHSRVVEQAAIAGVKWLHASKLEESSADAMQAKFRALRQGQCCSQAASLAIAASSPHLYLEWPTAPPLRSCSPALPPPAFCVAACNAAWTNNPAFELSEGTEPRSVRLLLQSWARTAARCWPTTQHRSPQLQVSRLLRCNLLQKVKRPASSASLLLGCS